MTTRTPVNKQQMAEIRQRLAGEYWDAPIDERPAVYKRMGETLEQYELVFDILPVHDNQTVIDLINLYCDDCRAIDENRILYSASGAVDMSGGSSYRHLLDRLKGNGGWKYIGVWSTGYRDVFIHRADRVELTVCEGDVSIVLCKTPEAFEQQCTEADECYVQQRTTSV